MTKKFKRSTAASLVSALAVSTVALASPAQAAGTKSLASVLTAKSSFDTDKTNYDIVTAAVLAVLGAKPNSPVKVLTDGTVALTAFIPNDGAFINLVAALTGTAPTSEQAAFNAVAGLGIDTVEQVLQYHVVPGAAIASADALKANGATLTTALPGKTLGVTVAGTTITLKDADNLAVDPTVILSQVDINSGNAQIAHGINAVLLPAALLTVGNNSLAAVLTAKSSFDKNGKNFDILTAAVLAVLKAKPDSSVKLLADGTVGLTAFIPTDTAFMNLVRTLTKKMPKSEEAAFKTVASLGVSEVEKMLLFHVVPGTAISSSAALKANGASLKTALDMKVIKVRVTGKVITLVDYNSKMKDPKVIQADINKGNRQLAHAIDAVLMP